MTTSEESGVLGPGTRVEKINSEAGKDTHQDGARATVLGPLLDRGYFVVWDDIPNVPVFVGASRIRPLRESHDH